MTELVFGYGSLVEAPRPAPTREPRPSGYLADLAGYRRRWQVAMDNSRDIPGYKYYVDALTGERPAVFVAFVDLAPDPGSAVNGVVFPVAEDALEALDARERNYERREVTALLSARVEGRVWAYFGRAEARERYDRGLAEGRVVVSRAYDERIRAGFAALGPAEWERFTASTDPPEAPARDLERIDVRPSG